MRTLAAHELHYVSAGLVAQVDGEDPFIDIPPPSEGSTPNPSAWERLIGQVVDLGLQRVQTFIDDGSLSRWLGLASGIGADGLRSDGTLPGEGCGTVTTDRVVPDQIFGVSLVEACRRHDQNYDRCLPKEEADRIFKQDVFDALTRSGIDSVRASVVSNLYFRGVSWAGGGAYAQQCTR